MNTSTGLVVHRPGILATTAGVRSVFDMIRGFQHIKRRKIGLPELALVFRQSVPEAVDTLRDTLEVAEAEEANAIWGLCKQPLRFELLMADDRTFSMDIYNKFELEPVFASRAFLHHHRTVRDTPYGRSYVQFDGDIVTRFAHLLNELPDKLAVDIARATNKKVMYLLYVWEFDEVDRYRDNNEEWEEATSWLRNGSPPDIDLNPLLFWLWEHDHALYQECMRTFFDPSYVEMRELFYEVRDRTERWREHQGQVVDPDIDEINQWLEGDADE